MMTDQEVMDLYRCLLGRDPENANTIAAFKAYYPNLERGRRAIFVSDEFKGFYERTTGRVLDAADDVFAAAALGLLQRATAAVPPPEAPQREDGVRAGLRQFFASRPAPGLALLVGHPQAPSIADLAPFERQGSAILQVASGFPPSVPLASRLPDGTGLLRLAADAEAIALFLAAEERRIDALFLLDGMAGPHWVDRLRGHFAARTLIVVGRPAPGFDPVAVTSAITASHHCETVVIWQGLRLLQVGGWMLPVTYAAPKKPPAPPARDAYPTLAIASIVRDEAICIQNMLASVRPVASFYAVLDTGSVDATPTLAQNFLAECGVPSAFARKDHTAFDDDFAAMRNAALDMVPDWVGWVLMLDADEEMVPEDFSALLELLAEAERAGAPDTFALPRYNFPGGDKSGEMMLYPDRQVRLLRNRRDPPIRYQGAVHETVSGTPHRSLALDASAIGLARGGPHIHHLVRRFRTPEQEERKQEFYREIARKRAAQLQGAKP
jgi:hypothetical protein